MSDAILLDRPADHVLRVTINREAARNAVNGAVATGMAAAVAQSEADEAVRVVILTGAGDQSFSAGADLKEVAAGNGASLAAGEAGFGGLVTARRTKPWIAAVNGLAYGGGLELALACDLVVAADHARFGLPEVQRGLAALAGGLVRLSRRIPRALALEMIATGQPIDAARAATIGLVNRVVPLADLPAAAVELATTIAGNAPLAVRESLIVARRAIDGDEAELWAMNGAMARLIGRSGDAREGPRAFVEKRAPRWTGR